MRLKGLFSVLMLIASLAGFAQSLPVQADEGKRAELREKIGLDLTVADFDTAKIDSKVMGSRLTGILEYLMENYQQSVYDRRLSQIAIEQNEALENVFFQLKKMRFINAVKRGDEITIIMRVDLQKNAANLKQIDLTFHFVDGVSEDEKTNDLFIALSHYAQARENIRIKAL